MSFNFNDLPTELQKFFSDYQLKPLGEESANHAIQVYLETFSPKSFKVKLVRPLQRVDGSQINEIVIEENNLYTAFLPQVWQGLNVEQKIQLINMTYWQIVNNDKTLKNNPPKLAFFSGEQQSDVLGLYTNDNHIVTIQLSKIIKLNDGFEIPSLIVHELTHAKQKIERDRLVANQVPLDQMSDREVAIMFQSTSDYLSEFKFFEDNDIDTLKEMVVGFNNITEQDLETYKKAISNNDPAWTAVYRLPYLCHPMEIEAYRTQNRFRNQMIDSLMSQYNIMEYKHIDDVARMIETLQKSANFKIDNETLKTLARLNYALGSTRGEDCVYKDDGDKLNIVCGGFKTLIDLYTNKQINNKLDYLDYNKLLELKQQQLEKQQIK